MTIEQRRAEEDQWVQHELDVVRRGEAARVLLSEGSVPLEDRADLRVRGRLGDLSLRALMGYGEHMVKAQASRCARDFGENEEYVGAGYRALERAIRQYNPEKGMRFLSYATWHVQDAMRRLGRPPSE